MIKNLLIITLTSKICILIWGPEVLETFFFDCLPRVFCVRNTLSWHENCIKTHFSIDPSVCIRVSKRIKLPSNLRNNFIIATLSKFFNQIRVSNLEILNHICISRTSFIFHWPSSIHEFSLTVENQLLKLLLPLLSFFRPPHTEEFHFNISKFSIFVFQ